MSKPQYTCITCRVAFNTAQEQRDHYKTDWHRYNLKRKVVGLPPISAEKFKEKVAAQANQAAVSDQLSECLYKFEFPATNLDSSDGLMHLY